MKRILSAALLAILCFVVLSGCSTMKTTWRSTKKLYKKYVNVDPTLDLNASIGDKDLQRLGELFMPVDQPLLNLTRDLGCKDTPPENEWVQQLATSHPWLSGVAVVDTAGVVKFQTPSTFLRQMDFGPLLELADRFKARQMGAAIKSDEFGTEVMLAEPYFDNNEWAGMIVAIFDPRSLMRLCPEPSALAVVSSDGTAWPGGSEQSSALAAVKWEEILKSTVQGTMSVAGGSWVWVARNLGQMHVIYLTDAQAAAAQAQKAEAEKAAAAKQTQAKPAESPAPAAPDAPVAP